MSDFTGIVLLLAAPWALIPLEAVTRRLLCRLFGHPGWVVLTTSRLEARCTRCGRQERMIIDQEP